MKRTIGRIASVGGSLAAVMLVAALPAWAGHEPFAVYEDWMSAPTIRSDRWSASGDLGHERRREVLDDKLLMRFRREGGTASDVGQTGFFSNRLNFVNPLAIDQIEAELRVKRLTVTGCAANLTGSIARAAAIDLNRFSDLDPAAQRPPGSLVGDHIARVQAARTSDSTDPDGVLQVGVRLFRCNNAGCSDTSLVSGPVTLGHVKLEKRFRLRLIWDAADNEFRAGLDDSPDTSLTYPAGANKRAANVPAALLRIQHLPANCTVAAGGPTAADAEIEVREVRTNESAIMP